MFGTIVPKTEMDRALCRPQEAERCSFTVAGAARYFPWLDTNAVQDNRGRNPCLGRT